MHLIAGRGRACSKSELKSSPCPMTLLNAQEEFTTSFFFRLQIGLAMKRVALCTWSCPFLDVKLLQIDCFLLFLLGGGGGEQVSF